MAQSRSGAPRDRASDVRELVIDRVGAQGDGVARDGERQIFVPFTLAGERVAVTLNGPHVTLDNVVVASPDRVAPVCRYFGHCGGCSLQHMAPAAYLSWKHDQVAAAFNSRGIETVVDATMPARGPRRRAVFSAHQHDHNVHLGFHAAGTHDLIDIAECAVLDRRIVAALPAVRRLIADLLPKREDVRVTVTMMSSGLDVGLDEVRRVLSPDVRTELARQAAAVPLARVSINGDTIFEALPATLHFGSTEVAVPPHTFIQAVREAEADMAELVIAAVGSAKTVVDLFSGVGAFTFPLSQRAKVAAYDSDANALAALQAGVKRATGIKPITTQVRDLFREPLSALELNAFDAIVFDPPRAGAEAQARMIAKSKVKTVVAVSCNPATLARDARVLMDGGYALKRVTPIDQFEYSTHIEAVATFVRDNPKR